MLMLSLLKRKPSLRLPKKTLQRRKLLKTKLKLKLRPPKKKLKLLTKPPNTPRMLRRKQN